METYSDGNNPMFEEGTEATDTVVPWYCLESISSTPKKVSRPPQRIQFNPEPCFPVTPLRTFHPLKDHYSGISTDNEKKKKKKKNEKKNKKKASVAALNRSPSETALRPKQSGMSSVRKTKKKSVPNAKRKNKTATELLNFDMSQMPSPFCSCTAMAISCYKWGIGGWQSACCTCNNSEYPLPLNPNKPGARVPGRKMSSGAYTKLVVKLVADGHNLLEPIDLKDHWARHGTNKFATIK